MRVYAQQSKQVVELTEPLGIGGEETVFVWPLNPGLVCKVYHESVLQERGDLLARKLTAMQGAPPDDPMRSRGYPTFAWPEELVFDATNQQRLVGFVMPRIHDSYSLHKLYSPGDRKQIALPLDAEGHSMEYYMMVATARNLAEAFRLLHARGHVMANVNEDDIRFRTNSTVSLIHNDSFQVRDRARGEKFLVSVTNAAYWPVDSLELQKRGEALATSHDHFGLALFLFRLLMNGVHPYHGMGWPGADPPTFIENIAAGHFPFVLAYSGGLRPPYHAPAFDSLPAELREMFQRCFVEGARNPSARADAATWVQALDRAQATLKRCERGHMHFAEASLCPWCELEDALTVCPNGHKYYRAEGSCPTCAREQKRAARRAGVVTPSTPDTSAPNMSRSVSQALGVGGATSAAAPPRSAPTPVPARSAPAPVPARSAPTPVPARSAPAPVPARSAPAPAPARSAPAAATVPVPTHPPLALLILGALLRNSKVRWGIVVLVALIVGLKFFGSHDASHRSKLHNLPAVGATPPVLRTNAKDGAVEVLIPAGAFQMGDSDEEDNPPHRVKLSAYWIYKNLVTVGQYKRYVASMKASGEFVEMPHPPDFDRNWTQDDHPIVNVSWDEAQRYCKWAGVKLPTEAQWEKAARGTDGRKYPWGNDFEAVKLWSSANGSKSGTHKVGEFGVSPYGVTDMAGNVWQWCQDLYDSSFWTDRSNELVDPVNNTGLDNHLLRGGSWYSYYENDFRCGYRPNLPPEIKISHYGFRCAAPAESR